MALEIKLSQKLSQSLVMTPQLQQAIKLLQLGREEYLEEIEKALLENPVLEDVREEERFEKPTSSDQQAAPEKKAEKSEIDLANYYDAESSTSYSSRQSGDFDGERPSLEGTLSTKEGLAEHLMWQLHTCELNASEKECAVFIIGNLDKNGYLTITVDELSGDCGRSVDEIERVLKVIQNFDPIGIGARNLQECLLLQLEALGQKESTAAKIVESQLAKLETRRYDAIAKELVIPVAEVYEAVKVIQKLEPRPGRPFVDEEPIYITPDIYVRKIEGNWRVSLNESGMPRIRIGKGYQELLDKSDKAISGDKEYLQERIKSASWLIRSIQQRQQTIHKVAESIMRFQKEFLDQGISGLRPLVLREVADEVEMHESTVSRVTTNKYIHTPHGVYELKFFFSSGLNSQDGNISSESVKEKIRIYVQQETPLEPLSDQALAEKLKKDGIDIARRTVAKYREMMGIPSSSARKKPF